MVKVLYVESRFRGRRPFAVLWDAGEVVIRPLDAVGAPDARWRGEGGPEEVIAAATAMAERQDAEDGLLLLSLGIPSLGISGDEEAASDCGESESGGEGVCP